MIFSGTISNGTLIFCAKSNIKSKVFMHFKTPIVMALRQSCGYPECMWMHWLLSPVTPVLSARISRPEKDSCQPVSEDTGQQREAHVPYKTHEASTKGCHSLHQKKARWCFLHCTNYHKLISLIIVTEVAQQKSAHDDSSGTDHVGRIHKTKSTKSRGVHVGRREMRPHALLNNLK